MMVGGAAVAQAQGSLAQGSLGSLMPAADVGLTVSVDADTETVEGVVSNSTESALNCEVFVTDADIMEQIQAAVADGDTLAEAESELSEEISAADLLGQNATAENVGVDADETADWSADYAPTEEVVAGAYADCGEDVDLAFAYEEADAGLLGSLDFGGSLGS